MTTVTFTFRHYLRQMLAKEHAGQASFKHCFARRASIKDVLESLGVPHPIIGGLTVNNKEFGFDYILRDNDTVEAAPLTPPVNPLEPHILRPEPLDRISFVADVNVGKLALHLRSLGFDTVYGVDARNGRLAEISRSEKRILLTRDVSLLKRKIVMHGYLPRAIDPTEQLVEVLHLYNLAGKVKPLSRCIPCNGELIPVNKEAVLDRLEPLTKKYYETFRICRLCDRIYWPGSHQEKIVAFVQKILAAVRQKQPGSF